VGSGIPYDTLLRSQIRRKRGGADLPVKCMFLKSLEDALAIPPRVLPRREVRVSVHLGYQLTIGTTLIHVSVCT
jgi:hypothetical protein